jgi:arylsulfatase A-like enzyme
MPVGHRPNILFILTDQQRFDSLAVNGNTVCQTPSTDRLAREGMNFRHAFTPTSLCSPARASLLTGLYSHNHSMTNLTNTRIPGVQDLPDHITTVAQQLAAAGYRTGYVGKWHTGKTKSPLDWGFDDYRAREGWHEWRPEGVQLEEESAIRLGYDHSKPMAARVPRPLAEYPEVGRTDAAIDLLEDYAAREAPFFLQLNYFGPHYPHYLPEPYHSMYDTQQILPCGNFDGRPTRPHAGYRWLRDRWCAPSDDWLHYAEVLATYYGQITLLEHEMARVLDIVDRLRLTESTLVIFASDHGEMGGGNGLLQKGAVAYDELYRVPMIARWPGHIDAGSSCQEMVNLFDLMPTMLQVAGITSAARLDARSALPLLLGERPVDWPEEVFCEYLAHQVGDIELKILRTKSHKLAVNLREMDELFDLDADPGETTNRIDDPSYGAVCAELAGQLEAHMERTGDPLLGSFSQRLSRYRS